MTMEKRAMQVVQIACPLCTYTVFTLDSAVPWAAKERIGEQHEEGITGNGECQLPFRPDLKMVYSELPGEFREGDPEYPGMWSAPRVVPVAGRPTP